MKLRIVVPIITDLFNQEVVKEVAQFKAPDTEIDVVNIVHGPASIESRYDEMLASPDIVEKVVQAEKDGCDGVFVDCFGDPGVHAAREMVRIPVVGAFQPAALTASLIAGRWSVVTVLKSVVPLVDDLSRKLGLSQNIVSIRDIDTPVLELQDKGVLEKKLLAQKLEKTMEEKGRAVPVVDPTAAAIGFLELLVRSKLSHSLLAYPYPPEKERKS